MSKEVKFLIFCIEEYKNAKKLTGQQAMAVFNKYNVIDYIIDCYEALHTTGIKFIVDDIDEYVETRQVVVKT